MGSVQMVNKRIEDRVLQWSGIFTVPFNGLPQTARTSVFLLKREEERRREEETRTVLNQSYISNYPVNRSVVVINDTN